jgi:hypothetical protein
LVLTASGECSVKFAVAASNSGLADGARGQVQPLADLPVGQAFGREPGYLQFLRRKGAVCRRWLGRRALPRHAQLCTCLIGPVTGADQIERRQSRTERPAGFGDSALAPQPAAELARAATQDLLRSRILQAAQLNRGQLGVQVRAGVTGPQGPEYQDGLSGSDPERVADHLVGGQRRDRQRRRGVERHSRRHDRHVLRRRDVLLGPGALPAQRK